MFWKIVSGVVAVALVIAYLGPIALKVAEPALTVVMIVGLGLMLLDLWQSIQSKDD